MKQQAVPDTWGRTVLQDFRNLLDQCSSRPHCKFSFFCAGFCGIPLSVFLAAHAVMVSGILRVQVVLDPSRQQMPMSPGGKSNSKGYAPEVSS